MKVLGPRFESVPAVREGLAGVSYLADEGIAGVVYLADRLGKPVLVEGPAGVGKTELAKAAAAMTGSRLIRLQCYEGLDESKALYEWNYKKQLLRIQAQRVVDAADGGGAEAAAPTGSWSELEEDIFSGLGEEIVRDISNVKQEIINFRKIIRPERSVLRDLERTKQRYMSDELEIYFDDIVDASEPVVLLVDEVDRVEVETEALLLEVLSDYQVSIPELGTVAATQLPLVFLTSNNTRELSEALKRRCLYLHIDYPELEREKAIVLTRVPEISDHLADQIVRIVRSLRSLELKKHPSVSETLDWARTLVLLGADSIGAEQARDTLHILLKYRTDIEKATKELSVAEGA